MILRIALYLVLAILPMLCLGVIFEDLPRETYDFVIELRVGGTAGNVIANRLSENPSISVLVLEAGGTNEDIRLKIPALYYQLPGSNVDWNFTARVGPNNRTSPCNRGFALGGSSSINWMAYTRGSSDDWDRIAALTGDSGWSWDSVQSYIRMNEHFTQPVDHHNTTGEFDPTAHGFDGINSVSLSGFRHQFEELVIQASQVEGAEFPFVLDYNAGDQLGVGWAQSTILNGSRSSSATSYLGPQFIRRPNLDVLLHAHVTRILPTTSNSKSFHTVEFSQDGGESFQAISAIKEIVLSSGTVGTPQILMNSGIGDSHALSDLGIQPVLHLPSVGQNMTEQPAVVSAWAVEETNDDNDGTIQSNSTLLQELIQRWNENRTGQLVDPPILAFGWFRVPDNSPIFETFEDPSAGPNTAHIEWIIMNTGLTIPPSANQKFISISPTLVSPASRGSIVLNSSNPFDHPIIDLNLISSEFDTFALREGLRNVTRFLSSPVFDGFILSSVLNINDTTTDDELDIFIRNTVGGAAHIVGTAGMSPKNASWGVLDPDLKLKGAEGVRVCDASVFPYVPAGHTMAPTYIVAERGADLIKTTWYL
ncbi:hypothetical protein VKT23_001280 [Stygiomarasmius scandens]|uniref:Glucose-methanol-choline oxidoreductase N-terminal domain-containing protein n=1 Tax=Marasmiellus scandens TaxID=2682957 RepID=A0ABR1K8J9_9AGAR